MDLIRTHWVALLVAVVVSGGLAYTLFGSGDDDDDDGKPAVAKKAKRSKAEQRTQQLCERVECDEDQREDFLEVLRTYDDGLRADRAELRRLHEELGDLFSGDDFDSDEADKLIEQIIEHRASIETGALNALGELHEELEDEQRARLGKVIARSGPDDALGLDKKSKSKKKKKKKSKSDKAVPLEREDVRKERKAMMRGRRARPEFGRPSRRKRPEPTGEGSPEIPRHKPERRPEVPAAEQPQPTEPSEPSKQPIDPQ